MKFLNMPIQCQHTESAGTEMFGVSYYIKQQNEIKKKAKLFLVSR